MTSFTHEGVTLIHGDCMDHMARMTDGAYSLAVVDPQYGIGLDGYTTSPKKIFGKVAPSKGSNFVAKEWDRKRPGKNYFEELKRVAGHQVIWGGNYFADLLPPSKGWIFWYKHTNGMLTLPGSAWRPRLPRILG